MNLKHLDFNALRVFGQVVEQAGFTATVRKTQRSVSSVSRQIAALEERLG